MGRTFDALLGRNFKAPKFKALLNLAICRLTVLKNQRQARCSLARSDIVELLNLGHHDRALLRVEQVIKEQNLLDVYVMIEGYCHLLEERIHLIEQERECPEELKEAVSSTIYASTRCGDFPELQEMRLIFTSQFGKEFAARAVELRNNCGVNPKILQKLSTRQPSLENRMKVLKEIASENNIVLHLEGASSMTEEEKLETEQKLRQPKPDSSEISGASDKLHSFAQEIENMEGLSDSMTRQKYKDVADAAEAAFKSAAYAAAAARAAVELSKASSHYPDDQNSPGAGKRLVNHDIESNIETDEEHTDTQNFLGAGKREGSHYIESDIETDEEDNLRGIEDQNVGLGSLKVHPLESYHSGSEDEAIHIQQNLAEPEESNIAIAVSNSNSDKYILNTSSVEDKIRPAREGINFDESDDETKNEESEVSLTMIHESDLDMKPGKGLDSKNTSSNAADEDLSRKEDGKVYQSQKKSRLSHLEGLKARLRAWKS
ncbi:hypothetical protein NMG60_11018989 [Bertholletia excelsa]